MVGRETKDKEAKKTTYKGKKNSIEGKGRGASGDDSRRTGPRVKSGTLCGTKTEKTKGERKTRADY